MFIWKKIFVFSNCYNVAIITYYNIDNNRLAKKKHKKHTLFVR